MVETRSAKRKIDETENQKNKRVVLGELPISTTNLTVPQTLPTASKKNNNIGAESTTHESFDAPVVSSAYNYLRSMEVILWVIKHCFKIVSFFILF